MEFLLSWFKSSSTYNWIFCLFRIRFLQAIQAVKIQFKIDKKSSSSNQIFQSRDFKKLVQMNTVIGFKPKIDVCILRKLQELSPGSRPAWLRDKSLWDQLLPTPNLTWQEQVGVDHKDLSLSQEGTWNSGNLQVRLQEGTW